MTTKPFHFNPLQVNCFVCFDEISKEAMIIDPSCMAQMEFEMLFSFVEKEQLNVKHIVITHPHIDHVIGAKLVCDHYNLPLTMHKEGLQILQLAPKHAQDLGLKMNGVPDKLTFVEEKDEIAFIGASFEVLYVPGHCDGSICLVNFVEKVVFTGDVLFNGSIGRTDLVTGDYHLLISGITSKVLTLPDDFVVRPGHGGRTTIVKEKTENPFF
jgi:glyoxylase-like metal-dependent hydrolase (beta-lactamase superfamily II)